MQVFYVNIGGGEPTVRPDFWELVDYATAHHVGVKFSTNGVRIDAGRRGPAGRHRLRRRPDLARRCDRRRQRLPCAGRARSTMAIAALEQPVATPASATPRSRWSAPGTTSASSTSSRRSPTATVPRCGSPGCGRPVAAPTCGTSCTRPPQQQRELYDWLVAHGDGVLTGDSFFHLAAFGEALPGPEPVRRRAGGVPDRPGRRRLRLPVRHPRPVPGRQHAARRAGSQRSGANSELFAELRGPQTGGACASCGHFDSLPGRLHGGQVLHRPAAGRPRPRVRAGLRRGGAGRERRRACRKPAVRPLPRHRAR